MADEKANPEGEESVTPQPPQEGQFTRPPPDLFDDGPLNPRTTPLGMPEVLRAQASQPPRPAAPLGPAPVDLSSFQNVADQIVARPRRNLDGAFSGATEGFVPGPATEPVPGAASLASEGIVHVETTLMPGPLPVAPTPYPDDPAAPLIVQNVVHINVRSVEFRESNTKLDELIRLLRQSNEIAGETRDQLIAEITAGRVILTAPKPDRNLLDVLLVRPLLYLANRGTSAVVGVLADEALHLLLRMLDTPIPL